MRSVLFGIVISAACTTAGVVSAQEATQQNQMVYSGQVLPGCIMAAPTVPSAQNATATSLSAGSADINVTQLVGDDGVPIGAQLVLSLDSACNQAHVLSIASQNGALINDVSTGDPGTSFRNTLPYAVSLSWSGQTQTLDSSDGSLSLPVGVAARGSVTVIIQIPAGGAPMVAGSYSDQLVLELGIAG